MTCQARFGETDRDIAKWQKEGYFGVEMESASMFAVSNHFNVSAACVIHVNDNLVYNEYVGSEAVEVNKEAREASVVDKYSLIFNFIVSN